MLQLHKYIILLLDPRHVYIVVTTTVFFNFSKYKLSKVEDSLSSKGLQVAVPPTEVKYADFMLPSELLFRDIKSEEFPSDSLSIIRNKLLHANSFSFAKTKSCKIKTYLISDEAQALGNITKQEDIIKQKADIGNTVVILDKQS